MTCSPAVASVYCHHQPAVSLEILLCEFGEKYSERLNSQPQSSVEFLLFAIERLYGMLDSGIREAATWLFFA